MDQSRFDTLTRALGGASTRRAGLKAALGGLLGVGMGAASLPALEGEAKKNNKKKNNKKKRCVGEGQPCNSDIDCCHDWLECFSGWCYARYSY